MPNNTLSHPQSQTTTYTCTWSLLRGATAHRIWCKPIYQLAALILLKIYQPQQTTEQFLCRSAECSSQQLRAPPIEASCADCAVQASISVQSRAKRRAYKRALCGLVTAHLRSILCEKSLNDCFADCDPPPAKRFTSHNGANARRKPLDFQWFAPAGRRQAHHFISNVDICSRRNLQHPNPTAMGTGARRDGSDKEFGLESI